MPGTVCEGPRLQCLLSATWSWASLLPQCSVLPMVVGNGCFVLILVRMAASPPTGDSSPAPAPTHHCTSASRNKAGTSVLTLTLTTL